MTHRTRFFLFLFFVLLFCTITPLAILYTAGYQLNLSWPLRFNKALQKTGMFVFDTEPSGASVYLDGKEQQSFLNKYFGDKTYEITPAKIMRVLPGDYDVKLELDGYWPWEKKLTVNPGQSTHAEDVVLFKKILPAQIIQAKEKNYAVTENKKQLAVLENNILSVVNLVDGTRTDKKIDGISLNQKIQWSPDNRKILAGNYLFDLDNQSELMNLASLFKANVKNIKWDSTGKNLYYEKNQKLYRYNFETQKSILANKFSCDDYLVENNLLCVKTTANRTTLFKISLVDQEIAQELELPGSLYTLKKENGILLLMDQKHSLVYLIDENSGSLVKAEINQAKLVYPAKNGEVLYTNNYEISLFNPQTEENFLLSRISEPVIGIAWHSSDNYFIYATAKNINVLELDNRDRRNLLELAGAEDISNPVFDSEENLLYFWAKIGNEAGIYKLAL